MNQNMPAEKERRLFKRYILKEPCLVTGDNMVGLIRDISCGGCSFQHVKKKNVTEDSSSRMLFFEPLGMTRVRVEVIEDVARINENKHSYATMYTRRVKFVGLSLLQMRSLQEFIRRRGIFPADAEEEKEAAAKKKLTLLPTKKNNCAVSPAFL